MKLFVIRHGESVANLAQCYAGQSDAKLTAHGRAQAQLIRPILKDIPFDKIYTSDLSRASDTCAIALNDPDCEKTKLLREYDVGSLEGLPFIAVDRKLKEKGPDYVAYGGENAEMVHNRVLSFMKSLESKDYAYVAAFCHYGVMNAMLKVVLGNGIDYHAIKTDNCAIHVFDYDGQKWRVSALNYMKLL